MTPIELATRFESLAHERKDQRAIWSADTGDWMTFGSITGQIRIWEKRLSRLHLRSKLVLIRISDGSQLIPALVAAWKKSAVTLILDPNLPTGTEAQVARAERPHLHIVEETLSIVPKSRSFRQPELLLGKLTSGTTGRPKALFFTADQMLADATHVTRTMGITRDDCNFAFIPLGHSYGLGSIVIPFLIQGTQIALPNSILPHAMGEQISQSGATVLPGTPALYRAFAKTTETPALASIRLFISAGARLDPGIARKFEQQTGRTIHNFYGSSETGGIAYDRSGRAAREGAGVGTALQGVSIRNHPSGRLLVTSPAVFTHGNRRKTRGAATVLLPDRGTVDADGKVSLADRLPKVLKVGGRRLFTDRLLAQLRSHETINDIFLTVISMDGTERLALAIESDTALTPREIRSFLVNRVPAGSIPRKILRLPDFPRTARGKADRRKLQQILEQGKTGTQRNNSL